MRQKAIFATVKISFLSAFNPYRGGISQFSEAVCESCADDHDCRAWTFTRQYPEILFPGKTQFDDSVTGDAHASRTLDTINPTSWRKTGRLINEFHPDWHINHFWMPFFGPAMGRVSKVVRPNSKVATILHNLVPHEGRAFDKQLTMRVLRQSQAFVTMSSSVSDDLSRMMPNAPILQLFHPLYTHFGEHADPAVSRESIGVPKDAKVLLFFGFIRDYKGLDILLDAFARLGDEYWLVVAGECYGSFAPYQRQIDNLPNRERVLIHQDYIPEEDVAKYWAAADLAVLPYKSATQSGITSIAFHFDTPVCVTDVGGLKEIVEHGRTGVVANEPTPFSVSEAVELYFEKFASDEILANIRGLKDELSWRNFTNQMMSFLEQI